MVAVRMGVISSLFYMGIVAGTVLIAAPDAVAQNVKCGKAAGDDAAVADAWTALEAACPCGSAKATKWRKERSAFVKCARNFAAQAVKSGDIRSQCKNELVTAAKRSTCARKKETVTCCKTSKNGTKSCSVTKNASKCKPNKQRFAQVGQTSSCLDACDDLAPPACITNADCEQDDNPCTGSVCDPVEGCQVIVDPFCDPSGGSGGGGSGSGGGGSGGTSCTGKGSSTHGLSNEEQKLVTLINNYRKNKGKLTACNSLNKAAQDHANDMRDKKYYAHKGKNGSEFWERACSAGYDNGCVPSTWMGEIITGWASTAEAAFQMWKGSPGHDYLMKEKNYTVAGIGHACGGPLGNYWVVDFAGANEASCK